MAGVDIGAPRIVVDVTDFRRVDCAAVAEQVRALL